MEKKTIKDWALDDRPREKLLQKGPDALSTSELLAILINNGTKEKTAVDVAKDLLAATGNDLQKLGRLSVQGYRQLKVSGLGNAKAITIVAALELGARRDAAEKHKVRIVNSSDIAAFLQAKLQHKKHEIFMAVFLNQSNKVLHSEIISEGGITGTIADPRIVLRKALEHNATSLILAHNHPSGNIKPSRQDKEMTEKIREGAELLDLRVIDHIIVSDEGYYSFADEGLL